MLALALANDFLYFIVSVCGIHIWVYIFFLKIFNALPHVSSVLLRAVIPAYAEV